MDWHVERATPQMVASRALKALVVRKLGRRYMKAPLPCRERAGHPRGYCHTRSDPLTSLSATFALRLSIALRNESLTPPGGWRGQRLWRRRAADPSVT